MFKQLKEKEIIYYEEKITCSRNYDDTHGLYVGRMWSKRNGFLQRKQLYTGDYGTVLKCRWLS